MTDPIATAIDNMTLEELKANARLAIVGNAWLNLDIGDLEDDHRDMADDALYAAESSWIVDGYTEFITKATAAGKDYDVASKNWHRWFLNKVPLGEDGEEIDVPPEGFFYEDRKPKTQEVSK